MERLLAACLLLAASTARVDAGGEAFPRHANVVDVTRAPYSARGDGVSDDTTSIQRALNENVGMHRLIYFPKGTYLVSSTLTWPKNFAGHENWGMTALRGEDRETTVLRLKDGSFTDARKPGAIMWCGGFGSADWFHNVVENLTFHVGKRNPGAVGLQFYTNNTGAVRGCRFVAEESSGHVGLDLAHRDMNGPLLVKDCEVDGFNCGIAAGGSVNSQTFEKITLRGQREVGLRNEGQTISIRDCASDNSVPAVSTYGILSLIDARFRGRGNASRHPAIVNYNGGRVFLRDVKTAGYRRALADLETPDFAAAYRVEGEDRPGSLGPEVAEYFSGPATSAFPSSARSLRLPVKDAPAAPWGDPARWAVVDAFGADPTASKDSAAAIQRAIDSGASTVFFPGHYKCDKTLLVRGKVARVVGLGGMINYGRRDLINFRVEDGAPGVVSLEHFGHLGGGVEIDTRRTVVLRDLETHTIKGTTRVEGGELFIENVVGDNFRFRKQRVWARQLDIENEGTHLTNDGGDLWVLGYKTERGGTLVHTLGGGRTEILGGFSYTTTAGGLAPMFVNDNSAVWAYFREVCYNGDPFATLVKETRGAASKIVAKGQGLTLPYSGVPHRE